MFDFDGGDWQKLLALKTAKRDSSAHDWMKMNM